MSEYWKSTPSYWCKHCKTYVRDTKLEKTNHEATPRHQGNLKRFLRDLHRGHEKDQREKDRAKDEVARLNGLVSGDGTATGSSSSSSKPTYSTPKPQATASQRKQQLSQLAEMGVSIPDEFRPDMAMAGEWQVTSERIIEDSEEKKPEAIALGVRKRAIEEEEEAIETKKRRWGTAIRTYPTENEDGDLDALLSNATRKGKGPLMKSEPETAIKLETKEEAGINEVDAALLQDTKDVKDLDEVKKEPLLEEEITFPSDIPAPELKQETDEPAVAGVVFKKRKAKNIRQK